MKWQIIQSNWFSAALILLLLVVLLQKKGVWDVVALKSTDEATMKSAPAPTKQANTALGLGMDPGRRTVPAEIDQVQAEAFLKRFAKVAKSERKSFGVPASILLATAFLNSHAGTNELAAQANNFFQIPCTDDWEGDTVDDENSCLRKYETAWAGWRDFSIFLAGQAWFGALKQSAGKDWQKWADGIQGNDISRIKHFNKKLFEVIEYYRLYELDKP